MLDFFTIINFQKSP